MLSAIARIQGVLLIIVSVYLGGATFALSIHTYLTIAAPVPTLLAANVILACLTAVALYTATRLLSRPNLFWMRIGGSIIMTVGIWQIARLFGAQLIYL